MCVSVSPVAMSVGLLVLENAGCWLTMYGLAYSLIPYLISPMWKWFLLCGEHLPCPLSQCYCGFCTCWHVSLSPKTEYLEIM